MSKNKPTLKMQIGKNGLTESFMTALKNAFKERENIRISVLKAGGHDREKIKQVAEEIIARQGEKFTCRIVGFTIFVKKWRKFPHQRKFSVH